MIEINPIYLSENSNPFYNVSFRHYGHYVCIYFITYTTYSIYLSKLIARLNQCIN